MSLVLNLTPELQALIDSQAKSLGQSPEQIAMAALQGRFLEAATPAEESASLPIDKWLSVFDAWVADQQSRNPNVDDSRESIYPDRW